MADETLKANSVFAKVARHPFSFAVLVLSAVILLVWSDLRVPSDQRQGNSGSQSLMGGDQPLIPLSPTNLSDSVRAQPKVLDALGGGNQSSAAGAIGDLVGRLEEKVKTDPKNTSNRLLLAQTYKELGRGTEAIPVLQELRKDDPENQRVLMVLVSIFSQSDDPQEVKEALNLVKQIKSDASVPAYLVQMYTGDALMRQNNKKDAVAAWKQALASMPEKDPYYRVLEQRVMELSAKESPSP